MKSTRIFKVGTILLVLALAVGIFAALALADGNGLKGKGNSNQGQNQNCEDCIGSPNNGINAGMGNSKDAPDEDGDGIPNGQDSDYTPHECDEACDGTCDSEPKGSGMRRNSSDNVSGLQAHVSGMEMKTMTIVKLANLWGVDANQLLEEIKNEFKLNKEYNINNTINDLRGEYRFSPYQIMEIAERIKTALVE
ncbi:MAG: hypothetical protein E4G71_02840 [Candidatus Atribacteria bacterium]|nr:MAG: hypothetical protein E4G71_02840 [Candidatus Atribacteria bacterium]